MIKLYIVSILLFISSFEEIYSKSQYDSLKIKISQMLVFGIEDAQKVLEEDSLLDAYSNTHLGGIILFEKNISKKRSKSLGSFLKVRRNMKLNAN